MIRKTLRLIKRLLSKIIRRIPFLRRFEDKNVGHQKPVYLHHKYDVRELLMQENEATGFNRYDMIVRLLSIECEKGLNDFGWDFYRRMQSARMGETWVEPAVERFKLLIASYDEKGYDSDSEIELDNSLRLIDGSHRMAMALYHHLPMISAKVNPMRQPVFYGIEWFHINGFSNKECEILQDRFSLLYKQMNVSFVCTLWHPVRTYFEKITEHLKLFGTVCEVKDFTLSEWDYRFYTKGIYHVDDIEDWKVEKKLEYMTAEKSSEYQLRMVALEISNPDFRLKGATNGTLSKKCEHIKRLIRDAYKDKINNYFYDIIMHIGDNFHQNEFINRLMTMPPIDVKTILQHIQSYNYVITKVETPYMPVDFPVHYPLGKDVDLICANQEEFRKVLASIKKDVKQYESYYDIKYVEKKDERGDIYRTLIRMEQENYLVFQFDISSQNGSMSLEFSEELCKGKVGKSDYFIPTVSTEILVRIDEIANYPNKLQHIRYIRQHLSSINDNLADKYLPSNYKSILNRIIEEQVGGGENGIIDEFINKLLELEFLLNDYLIPKDAICIVGSSVLTIRGIRSNHDIDIVMLSHYRKRFGLELYKLNDTIEIVTSGWARSKHRKTIPDDILINDNRFHTMWNGFKFANIDMLRERKEYQGRPKDVEDLKLIDEYIKDNK